MIALGINGCCGKMGKSIARIASTDSGFTIKAALETASHPDIGKNLGDVLGVNGIALSIQAKPEIIKDVDVVTDFTGPMATIELLAYAIKYKKAMVIGTTGLDSQQVQAIQTASGSIPIVFSPNMSLGVNLLFRITQEVAQNLGREYALRICEAHHVHKKDAPSGTAKKLAEILKEAQPDKDIPIESIREDEIVGDHSVFFEGPQDIIVLKHSAKTRDILAQGALEAAKFVVKQPAGLYNMQNVIENLKKDKVRAW